VRCSVGAGKGLSTPLQVVLAAGSLEALEPVLALPELASDDAELVRSTQRGALHAAVMTCAPPAPPAAKHLSSHAHKRSVLTQLSEPSSWSFG
jgi:hypothetical protein